jgi:uncharacterized membrane protein
VAKPYAPDLRTCQFCKKQEFVYVDGVYRLVKYGVRHYAHPVCLAMNREGARGLIPEHERRHFDAALVNVNDWERGIIKQMQMSRVSGSSLLRKEPPTT